MWQELTVIKVSCTDKFLLISLVNYSSLHVQFYSRHKTLIWYDPPNWNANHLPHPHKSSPTPSQIISYTLREDHLPHSHKSFPILFQIISHTLTYHLPLPHKSSPTTHKEQNHRGYLPRMCIIHSSSPGLRMQLQVGLISCAAVTRGKKPLPLLVEYIESR